MSDPLRTDSLRAQQAASEPDREAKLEQLLLLGLDHYFAAEYEQAINVWTRALFIDRSHARARAYIERARSALAERQRESEELLQNGVAAFDRGEPEEARRLLQAALHRGAPPDEALAVLGRLNRLEQGGATAPPPAAPPVGGGRIFARVAHRAPPSGSRALAWAAMALVVVAAAAVAAIAGGGWPSTLALRPAAPAAPVPASSSDRGLPLPRRGETALSRARTLAAAGQLYDALAALDLVRPTDAEKEDADRLRADIQRQLIRLGPGGASPSPGREQEGAPLP
jgi:hypothetical protein